MPVVYQHPGSPPSSEVKGELEKKAIDLIWDTVYGHRAWKDRLIDSQRKPLEQYIPDLVANWTDKVFASKVPFEASFDCHATTRAPDRFVVQICDNAGGFPDHMLGEQTITRWTKESSSKQLGQGASSGGLGVGLRMLTKGVLESSAHIHGVPINGVRRYPVNTVTFSNRGFGGQAGDGPGNKGAVIELDFAMTF